MANQNKTVAKEKSIDLNGIQSIDFEYKGVVYTLEFNRKTTLEFLDEMKALGIPFDQNNIESIENDPIKYVRVLDLMFRKAFEMHHADIDDSLVDEILDRIDKTQFWDVLFALMEKPINSLTDSEEKKKAGEIKWKVIR